MFSNGKFKNVVADVSLNNQLGPGEFLHNTYFLMPMRAPTKNWIAVEGALFNTSADTNLWSDSAKIAPSSPMELQPHEDRNVFAIYVSYYVKVKLTLSGMGGEVCLKLPFVLGYVDTEGTNEAPSTPRQIVPKGLDSIDAVCEVDDKTNIAGESTQKNSTATNDTRIVEDDDDGTGEKVESTVTVQIHTPNTLVQADI